MLKCVRSRGPVGVSSCHCGLVSICATCVGTRYSAGDLFDYLAANGAMPEPTAVTLMCPAKTGGL